MKTLTGKSSFRKDREVTIKSVVFNIDRSSKGDMSYRLDGLFAKTNKMKKFHHCTLYISFKKLTFSSLWDYGKSFSFYELTNPEDLLDCEFVFRVGDFFGDKYRNDALITDFNKGKCVMELHNLINRCEKGA